MEVIEPRRESWQVNSQTIWQQDKLCEASPFEFCVIPTYHK